jgi:hypothetical protein
MISGEGCPAIAGHARLALIECGTPIHNCVIRLESLDKIESVVQLTPIETLTSASRQIDSQITLVSDGGVLRLGACAVTFRPAFVRSYDMASDYLLFVRGQSGEASPYRAYLIDSESRLRTMDLLVRTPEAGEPLEGVEMAAVRSLVKRYAR